MLRKSNKEDYTQSKVYRFIILLDTLDKTLESVMAIRLSYLTESNALFPKEQMSGRHARSTESALELLTEQIHRVWNCGKNHVASLLCLDGAGAFDNVSHPRLLHNLRKRRIPAYLIDWVLSFLKEREASIIINGHRSEARAVHAGIPQGSPVSLILYLFFNADLIDQCARSGLKASAIGFVDDVNILIYGKSTEDNCRTLGRLHDVCKRWAEQHGATFAPAKYELIHLTRTPKRFNMKASLKIGEIDIETKTDVRVLGLQIDTKLKWGPHIQKIEDKMIRQTQALHRLTAST